MNKRSNLKRPLLYLLVASVLFGAALGIIIVLRNKWDWFEVRVILTTVTVAIASLRSRVRSFQDSTREKSLSHKRTRTDVCCSVYDSDRHVGRS